MKYDIMNQTEEFAKSIHFQNELIMENWLNSYFINKENLIMGKYDNVTMKEYMEKKKKMLNNLGRLKGQCIGLSCSPCPFYDLNCNEIEFLNPDKALEIVMEYETKVD